MIYSIVMVISMMGAYLIITTKELTVLRQFIALEVRVKINLQIIAEVGKLNHSVVIYRNAILSALFLQILPSHHEYKSALRLLPLDSDEEFPDIRKNVP